MVCSFGIYAIQTRRPTSILAGVVFLCFCHHLKCFVHSFQSSTTTTFKRNSCDTIITYKNAFLISHRARLDGLSQFVTIDDNNDDDIDVGGGKTSSEEQFADVKVLKTQNEIDWGQERGESDYCYVNLDDISAPFVSREDSESTFIEYSDDGMCLPAGPVGQLKEAIANFLVEPSVEILIALVVLLNSLLVALSTLDSLSYFLPYIRNGEIMIGTIFLGDFIARWFSSSRDEGGFIFDLQFVLDILVVILPLVVSTTPSAFWQEVTFLPSALTQPSGLFNLQLLRVLRLQRFLQDLDTFEPFVEQALGKTNMKTNIAQDWQLQLARVVLTLFTLISVSTGLIYTAEHLTNPNINNYFDALYFGLTTLTTVGFGDVSPVTWQGRLIVCGSIIFGVAVVPAQAAALLEALLDRENVRNGRTSNGDNRMAKNGHDAMIGTNKFSSPSRADDSVLALDTTTNCSRCGASFHWSCARYCYKCGEEIE
jgi:voltage-gated potassium channel Kch